MSDRPGLREELAAAARRVADEGLVVGTGGNLSVRDGDDVLVTAATRSLLTRSHELVSRGEVTVKGKSRPLEVWAPLTSSSWDTDTDGQAVLGA